LYNATRRKEYDVDEDGSEAAGGKEIANMTRQEDQRASSIVSAALTGTVGSCTIRRDVTSTLSMRMVVRLMQVLWMIARCEE